MSNRLRRTLVVISMGGMAFGLFGALDPTFGCQPFAQNEAYVGFLRDSGTYAVQVGVGSMFDNLNVSDNLRNWFETPVTNLYTNLWQASVNYTYPTDPVYSDLLVD